MDNPKPTFKVGCVKLALLAALVLAVTPDASAQDAGQFNKEAADKAYKRPYSPYAGRNYPMRPLFGDTHLHTSNSLDAGMLGTTLGPEEAYRFAKGHEVTSNTGQRVKLARPLDFLLVSEHSDFMGVSADLVAGKPELLADPTVRGWYDLMQQGKAGEAFMGLLRAFGENKIPPVLNYQPGTPAYRSVWQRIIKAAEEANDPGRFTTFIAYEWTSNTAGNNCTATSSSATTPPKPARSSPTPQPRRWGAATIPATCGSGWLPMKRKPAATCWLSLTTATFPTDACFPSSSPSPANQLTASMPKADAAGSRSTKRHR
jgi:hypothetical protein